MEYTYNRGYIHTDIPAYAIRYGSESDRPVIAPDRNWGPYLPEFEEQRLPHYDTMACVTFSALNCLEILAKRQYGIDVNFSDRFTAKMSGTTKWGNTMWSVAGSIKDDGVILEKYWPFQGKNFDEYYSEIPVELMQRAKANSAIWEVDNRYVYYGTDIMWDSLQYAPLQVALHAYPKPVNGIYPKTIGDSNHVVTLYGAEYGKYWKIYDHYAAAPHKKLAWDYLFWAVNLFSLKHNIKTMKFQDNYLVLLVDGPGGAFLALDEKLLKMETFEHMLHWVARNNGDTRGRVMSVGMADIQSMPIEDFKGNKIEL